MDRLNRDLATNASAIDATLARNNAQAEAFGFRGTPSFIVGKFRVPGILTTAIFAFTLAMQDFVYALTFTSSSSQQPLNVGIPASLIRGDIYFWGELMAAALLAGVPVAILYNFFLDYFVEGITGGALKN